MKAHDSRNGQWLFVTPIEGLVLTDFIKNEIKVDRVTFVSRRKLPLIRKRFGLPTRISELYNLIDNESGKYLKTFLEEAEAYALLPYKGSPKNKKIENTRIVQDELNLLLLSTLYYQTRKFNTKVQIKESDAHNYHRGLNIFKESPKFNLGWDAISYVDVKFESHWMKFQKRSFFFQFLKLIQKRKTPWLNILIQAGKIAGKSQNETDLANALLFNVIALEMLLTTQNDKISEKLPKRIGFFIDWSEDWEDQDFEKKILETYGKRCAFVHNGETETITKEDVIFSDSILYNVLNNIVLFIRHMPSKTVLIELAEKYDCEKKLGIKSKKYQLGKFQYHRIRQEKMTINELLETLHNKR